jgi:hypothetical protein
MSKTWSEWQRFPDPRYGEMLVAPFGVGCYELRLGKEKVLCGRGKNVALRMTSLLPRPYGQGTRKNAEKRNYVFKHLGLIEYRTIPCLTYDEAKEIETEMRRKNRYRFHT